MILWITALLLIVLLALFGSRMGAVHAAISLAGLILGALLAMPLAPLIRPVVGTVLHNPFLLQIVPPVVVFLLIVLIFKIVAFSVHGKVVYYYDYKATETKRLKWQRLNEKLGLCIGALNGALYFFLLMIPIYVLGYLTVQVASGDEMPKSIKIVNSVRQQLHSQKLDKFLAAHDPAPEQFYDASDIIALVQRNPLLESRLGRYPDFLSLAERPEFQAVAADVEVNEMIQSQKSIADILAHPKVQAIVTNAEITAEVTRLLASDLKDLREFLETGKSPKYDPEKILGRWVWNRNVTINSEKKKHNVSPTELQRLNLRLAPFYGSVLVAMIDGNRVLLKRGDMAAANQPPVIAEGTWKNENGVYQISFTLNEKLYSMETSFTDDNTLQAPFEGITMTFDREL